MADVATAREVLFLSRTSAITGTGPLERQMPGATATKHRACQRVGVRWIAWFGYFGLIPCSLDRDELPLSVEFQAYLSDPKHSVLLESILESGISLEMGNYLLSRCFAG